MQHAAANSRMGSGGIVSMICVPCDIIRGVVSIVTHGGWQFPLEAWMEQGESNEKCVSPWSQEIDGETCLHHCCASVVRVWGIHHGGG
jgi:hypothetical protein